MRRLPLFVLPVVLLPGTAVPLHVFEPRYRRMIARCLEGDRRFGFLFHDFEARPEFRLAEGAVGCVAEIMRFHPLPDGRSVVMAHGIERFRVVDGVEAGEPYLEALVEPYGDTDRAPDLAGRRCAVQGLLTEAVHRSQGAGAPAPAFDTAEDISFLLAATIQIDPRWRQLLLEETTERSRLQHIEDVLRGLLDGERGG